jgi:hypothetical protein
VIKAETKAELRARLSQLCAEVGDILVCLQSLEAMDIAGALSAFQQRHFEKYGHAPSENAIARAIRIDRNDLRRVKLGQIPPQSVMAIRVSRFLKGDSEIARPQQGGRPKKQVRENRSISY